MLRKQSRAIRHNATFRLKVVTDKTVDATHLVAFDLTTVFLILQILP